MKITHLLSTIARFRSLNTIILYTIIGIPALLAQDTIKPIPGISVSGTLPVCYVNTTDSLPIESKEEYITATIWIDPMGIEGIEEFGSKEEPYTLNIRGRGNSSWTNFTKKPYKLKFNKKVSPFGFAKNKHFALISHAPTQLYVQNATGFEIARLIDLGWVPNTRPVEVVLNGINLGVYSFSETVRIDPGRIEIEEQPDNNTDEATIDKGWLLEIDNYDDSVQIVIPQCFEDDNPLAYEAAFTIKTPEELSIQQLDWIINEMTDITKAIYNPDKTTTHWDTKLDMEMLAKYYIVQELACNFDAFVGSTYLYKGEGEKWIFGPIWDMEWTFVPEQRTSHLWDERFKETNWKMHHVWIEELLRYPAFCDEIRNIWTEFYSEKFDQLLDFVETFKEKTCIAYETNAQIWPSYNEVDIYYASYLVKTKLVSYAEWFNNMVNSEDFLSSISSIEANVDNNEEWYSLQGIRLKTRPSAPGIYINRKGNRSQKVQIK